MFTLSVVNLFFVVVVFQNVKGIVYTSRVNRWGGKANPGFPRSQIRHDFSRSLSLSHIVGFIECCANKHFLYLECLFIGLFLFSVLKQGLLGGPCLHQPPEGCDYSFVCCSCSPHCAVQAGLWSAVVTGVHHYIWLPLPII